MASALSYLHFFCGVVYVYLCVFILRKNSRAVLNRVCAVFIFLFAVWSFAFMFVHGPLATRERAVSVYMLFHPAWLAFSSFFLWFVLIFTLQTRVLSRKSTYVFLFLPPLILIVMQYWKHALFNGTRVYPAWFGWGYEWTQNVWVYFYYVYLIVFNAIGCFLMVHFIRTAPTKAEQKATRLVLWASLFSLTVGSVTNVVCGNLGMLYVPHLAHNVLLIWVAVLTYAIVKYHFLDITPAVVVDRIIDTMSDGLILVDRDDSIVRVNNMIREIFGRSDYEMCGQLVTSILQTDVLDSVLMDAVAQGTNIKNMMLTLTKKDGDKITVFLSASSIFNEAGDKMGGVYILTDITELTKIRDSLLDETYFSDSLINSLPGVFFMITKKGKHVRWNENFERECEYSNAEIHRMLFFEVVGPQDREMADRKIEQVFSEGEFNGEIDIVTKSGVVKPFYCTGRHFVIGDDEYCIGLGIPLQAIKKMEQELRKNLAELQEFKEATVGREQVVIDLKREVNELSKELGRPEPHDLSFLE